jgi:hypothetical protein
MSIAPAEGVVSGITVQAVVPFQADEAIIAAATPKRVVSEPPVEGIAVVCTA